MSEWRELPLRDLCEKAQYGITTSASSTTSGWKLLRITDIVPERLDWRLVPHCDISERDGEKFALMPGDIVIARTGATVGYAKYLVAPPPRAVFASYLVRFRVRKDVDSRYIGYVVESSAYKRFIAANAGGAAQPNANAQTLGLFPVAVPDYETQRRIGAFLSVFDELIEINERRIELLEDLARSLYREWFVRFRFPGHEDLELADSELGPIPSGWAVRHLGDVCDRITDGAHASPRSMVLGKPMASVKDMTHLSLDLRTCRLISTADFDRLSQQDCRPLVGDVLVSKDGAKYLDKVFEVQVENDVVVLRATNGFATRSRPLRITPAAGTPGPPIATPPPEPAATTTAARYAPSAAPGAASSGAAGKPTPPTTRPGTPACSSTSP